MGYFASAVNVVSSNSCVGPSTVVFCLYLNDLLLLLAPVKSTTLPALFKVIKIIKHY